MLSLKYVIELSAEDQAKLTEIVTKGKSPARTILRANIFLASDRRNERYLTISEISKAYHTTPITVQTVRTSYCEKGLEATINRKKRETPLLGVSVLRTTGSQTCQLSAVCLFPGLLPETPLKRALTGSSLRMMPEPNWNIFTLLWSFRLYKALERQSDISLLFSKWNKAIQLPFFLLYL